MTVTKIGRLTHWVGIAAVVWIGFSLIPPNWRARGTSFPIVLMTGTLVEREKDKNGKTKLKVATSLVDWIGIALLIAVIAAVLRGVDLLALVKILSGK